MTAAVFSAFSLEAYLNHLGATRFRCWEELERLSVDAKLSLLLENLGQSPDFSKRPFQTTKILFRIRNQLAHGKTEKVEEATIQKLFPGERPRYPEGSWERLCTKSHAVRFHEDSVAVIRQLDAWTGEANPFLFSLEEGESTRYAVAARTGRSTRRAGKPARG
jgi:hypothetical protein